MWLDGVAHARMRPAATWVACLRGGLDIDHLAGLDCHSMPDCLDMDCTTWLLFGIVVVLVFLAILALFEGWFPF
jgi:hypothetical protein